MAPREPAREPPRPVTAPGAVPPEVREGLRSIDDEVWLKAFADEVKTLTEHERASRARAEAARETLRLSQGDIESARREAASAQTDYRAASLALAQAERAERQARIVEARARAEQDRRLRDLEVREAELAGRAEQLRGVMAAKRRQATAKDETAKALEARLAGVKGDALARMRATLTSLQIEAGDLWGEVTRLEAQIKEAAQDAESYKRRTVSVDDVLDQRDAYEAWIDTLSRGGQGLLRPAYLELQRAHKALSDAFVDAEGKGLAVQEARAARTASRDARDAVAGYLAKLETSLREAERQAAEATATADDARERLKAFETSLETQAVIPYSVKSTLRFTINMYTGAVFAELDTTAPGLAWTRRDTAGLFAGTRRQPPVDALLLAAVGAKGVDADVSDDYAARRVAVQAQGGEAFYASRRFVRFAEGASFLRRAADIIASGDDVAIQALKKHLLLEYADILAWLKLQGSASIQAVAPKILAALINGDGKLEDGQLAMGKDVVKHTVTARPSGRSYLPAALREEVIVTYGSRIPTSVPEGTQDHHAYWLRWNGAKARPADLLRNYSWQRMAGRADLTRYLRPVLTEAAKGVADKAVAALLASITERDAVLADDRMVGRIVTRLGVADADLRSGYLPGSQLIVLTGSPLAKRVERFFRDAAVGNQGRVAVELLEFDLNAYRLTGTLTVTHEHSWGSRQALLAAR